ncbi:hypothetical protein YC2023_076997 [Brassica napus]
MYKLFSSPDKEFWEKNKLHSQTKIVLVFSVVLLLLYYFNTKPYACDPSTLLKYPRNNEMDANYNLVFKETGKSCRTIKELTNLNKLPTQQVCNTTSYLQRYLLYQSYK